MVSLSGASTKRERPRRGLTLPGMLGFEVPEATEWLRGDQHSPILTPKGWAALPRRHWPPGVGGRPQAEGPSPTRRPISDASCTSRGSRGFRPTGYNFEDSHDPFPFDNLLEQLVEF